MDDRDTLIRQSQLLNRLVLDRETTEELGRIEVVWMHPPAHRVMGFICKPGFMSKTRYAFSLKQLDQLGPESILVKSKATETTLKEVRLLETLIGHEIWTDGGEKLGKIIDCVFDRHRGEIPFYLFKTEGWRSLTSGLYQLPPTAIMSYGSKRVLATAAVSEQLTLYQGGIEQKLHQASDRIKETYSQELESLSSQAQKLTQQAEARLQKLSQQATEKVETLGQSTDLKAEKLSGQWQVNTQKLAQQFKQRGRSLWERVEDGAFTLIEEWPPITKPPIPSTQVPATPPAKTENDSVQEEEILGNIPDQDLEDDQPWI
ncbi:MAG: photosystem reaction center subunit H [Acaryochloridaceae cyanobacterium SU_2_1]|nr:photosystem reaction center subunit H [Acaryochloridaceae cyanobacterium SU_2_1]NJM95377.1 photosystem reaction center subunit H [Acaryochloridaceae cyanobacterium CSU_5_19]